ncbi:hypothetical protein CYY_004213 [Polysphondylium violaceum]|uniref:Transcription factor IIIC-gamma subunit n=1 Tax=Polysphondylium violaceum TaxID=133409 RepID=A0A8J4PUY1_9MYCE|nr:hypothetical protein CYY_004213 [Polysphondylium violaceum]
MAGKKEKNATKDDKMDVDDDINNNNSSKQKTTTRPITTRTRTKPPFIAKQQQDSDDEVSEDGTDDDYKEEDYLGDDDDDDDVSDDDSDYVDDDDDEDEDDDDYHDEKQVSQKEKEKREQKQKKHDEDYELIRESLKEAAAASKKKSGLYQFNIDSVPFLPSRRRSNKPLTAQEQLQKNISDEVKAMSGKGALDLGDDDDDEDESKKGKGRGPRKIAKHVKKIEAKGNEAYSKGDFKLAFDQFSEVVRLAPQYPVPYKLMARIMEENGDKNGALNFYMYAATFEKTDSNLWSRVGALAMDLKEDKIAIYAYGRAIRNNKADVDAMWNRSQLFIKNKELHKAMNLLRKIETLLGPEEKGNPQIIKAMEDIYAQIEKPEDAPYILEGIVANEMDNSKDIHDMPMDNFNLLLEVFNKTKRFSKATMLFEKLDQKCKASTTPGFNIPIDIIANACVSYFSLNNLKKGQELLDLFMETQNVSEVLDLYLYLGKSLYAIGQISIAIDLYKKMLNDPEGNLPPVWCKIAECYRALKDYRQATVYLHRAHEALPDDIPISFELSELYILAGEKEKSDEILNKTGINSDQKDDPSEKEMYDSTLLNLQERRNSNELKKETVRFQFQHAMAYFNVSKYSQFLGIASALLNGSEDKYSYNKKVVLGSKRGNKRKKDANEYYEEMYQHKVVNFPFAQLLNEEDYFKLIFDTSKVLSYYQRYSEASQYLRYALRNIKFVNPLNAHQLKFLLVGVAFNDKNYVLAFKYVKYVCFKKPYSTKIWNLFNKIILNSHKSTYSNHNRFLLSVSQKYPQSVPVMVLLGNQCKITDNTKGALYEYLRAYKCIPDEPLINLLIGVIVLSQVMGRQHPNRHKVANVSFAFFYKYAKIRGECEETNYNIGRAFHQLGISNMAIHYYELVLNSSEEIDPDHSLKQEAAFNLSLLYKSQGNIALANEILNKYVVV